MASFTNREDFEAEFYEGKDKIYFSTCWYQRYAPHIGETVVIKDEKGNKFIAFVKKGNKPHLVFNQTKLRFMYQLTLFGIIILKLVDDSKFEMKVLGHYLGKIDTNDPAKYDGHWGYDPMWVLEISEEMSTEGKLLMIPDDVVDIIYHGSVDYELEVSVSETNECYTWEVQHMGNQFLIAGGWVDFLKNQIKKGIKKIFFYNDGAKSTVVLKVSP
ncbi:uncharacterized protein LOC123887276 isoform X2 [Trifolium pratense]|uniref:Uncharacterized protein n=1 Tax=Trifolium pratense TaxID=57577 RepID=A0ACB0L6S4_TRIPR|nr:uncharacterized protein LOC123887276 isoform X2 [Trifolium pratense]CAJ2664156.1 unnamed protein product [Trifolium pratense]